MTQSVVDEILAFWFGDGVVTPEQDELVARRWFVRDAAFDREVRERFGTWVERAIDGVLGAEWTSTPPARLAQILLLDQFTRNIYRSDPRAFAGDTRAQSLALDGIERGDDLALPPERRVFFYMPLEHAEDIALQQRSVEAFSALATLAPPELRARYDNYLDYARRHRDVIERYGRFPHRNAVLGRVTTPEEQAYLEAGGGF